MLAYNKNILCRREMLESKLSTWVEKEEKRSVMCIKAVVKRKGRDERGSVHDEE